jgi:uncharacterized delta-60 repeat protein
MRSSNLSKRVQSLLSRKTNSRDALQRAVAGTMEPLESRRLLSAGQLDPTFGQGGVIIDSSHPGASALLVLPSGKFIEAGQTYYDGGPVISVARYNIDGTHDTSFGYQGQVTTVLSRNVPLIFDVHSPKVETDGKITLITSSNGDFTVIRYNADGQLDSTFGTNGIVSTDFGGTEHAAAIAIAPNGDIVVAGTTDATSGTVAQIDVARYHSNGSLDTTFGTGGKVVIAAQVGSGNRINDLALQSDGKVVLVGEKNVTSGASAPLILRLNVNGSPDGTLFANPPGLSFYNPLNVSYQAITIDKGGKLLVTAMDASTYDPGPAIIRFNTDGTLDLTFGTGGVVQDALPVSNLADIYVQPDGKIVAAGYYSDLNGPSNNSVHFLTERFNTDGSRDTTFGTNGRVITVLAGNDLAAHRAAAEPDGSILEVGGIVELAMVRYTGDGSVITAGNSISGAVFNDVNHNGVRDAGEAPVAGRQVYLDLNGVGVFATGDPLSTTDAAGHYAFNNLPAANYLVRLVPMKGVGITAPLFGGKFFVQLGQNQSVTGEDFGTIAFGAPSFPLNNGQLLVTTSGIGPSVLTRYNADGSTDVSFGTLGSVTIPGVPSAAFQQPNGNILVTTPTALFTLSPSGAILTVVPISGGTISGRVYNDANNNGVQDFYNNELGVAGRQVYLDINGLGHYVIGDPVSLTNANGDYSFGGLAPGNYLVRLIPITGRVVTSPVYGGKYFVQLGSNQNVTGDDFGTLAVPAVNLDLPNGQLLVASGNSQIFTLSRYNPDGSIDTTYGTRGVSDPIGFSPFGGITQMLQRQDGNTLVQWTGGAHFNITYHLALVSPSGVILHDVALASQSQGQTGYDTIEGMALVADNKVVIAAQHDDPSPNHHKFVRRYNADLTLDTAFGQPTVTGAPLVPLTSITSEPNGNIVLTYGSTVIRLDANGNVIGSA